jgi:AcrR family transcriptional regulator
VTSTGAIARRPPFSANPHVGQRGQRTQQRILDAALREFAEQGYHGASVDGVAKRAGCSRVAFYQYFADKQDVFAQLSEQVSRQVTAAIEALDLVTPDQAGWQTLRSWIERQADIFERYSGLYHTYEAAAATVPDVAAGGATAMAATVTQLRAKVTQSTLPGRTLEPALAFLFATTVRSFYLVEILRRAAPEPYPVDRVLDALADVVHRSVFGRDDAINVRGPGDQLSRFEPGAARLGSQSPGPVEGSTAAALRDAARAAFSTNGFSATRVDDIARGAGLSHGAFYRHFSNKADVARSLVVEAVGPLADAVASAPDTGRNGAPGRAELRRWLRRCHAIQQQEAAMIRVWVDAALHEPDLAGEAAASLGWARQRLASFLQPRDFGDVDADAIISIALLDVLGGHPRAAPEFDAAAVIVERGFLGQ